MLTCLRWCGEWGFATRRLWRATYRRQRHCLRSPVFLSLDSFGPEQRQSFSPTWKQPVTLCQGYNNALRCLVRLPASVSLYLVAHLTVGLWQQHHFDLGADGLPLTSVAMVLRWHVALMALHSKKLWAERFYHCSCGVWFACPCMHMGIRLQLSVALPPPQHAALVCGNSTTSILVLMACHSQAWLWCFADM